MITSRILVIVVALVIGVNLLIGGTGVSHSTADHVASALAVRLTDATTRYILSGVLAVLVGISVVFRDDGDVVCQPIRMKRHVRPDRLDWLSRYSKGSRKQRLAALRTRRSDGVNREL